MEFWARRPALVSAAVLIVTVAPWLSGRGLQNPDETRYAEIPREMIARGDFIVPYLNGVPFFEKPVLGYWLEALSLSLFGPHEWALRLWPLLCGVVMVVLAATIARRWYGNAAALAAGLVAATSLLIVLYAQLVSLDLLVATLIAAAQAAFLHAAARGPGTRGSAYLPLHILCALAVLAKGLIGVVLPGLAILPWILLTRRYDVLRGCLWPPGVLLFLLIAVPWHVAVELRQPGFLSFYFIHEHLQRFATTVTHRRQGIWFLPLVLVLGMVPWTGFLWPALRRAWLGWRSRAASAPADLFLMLWAGTVFLFFWSSDSQLPGYLLPMFCPLAVLVGRALAEAQWSKATAIETVPWLIATVAIAVAAGPLVGHVRALTEIARSVGSGWYALPVMAFLATAATVFVLLRRSKSWLVVTLGGGAAAVWIAGMFVADILQPKSIRDLLLAHAAEIGNADVVVYRAYLLDPAFYLAHPVIMVEAGEELQYGASLAPRPDLMISRAELIQRLRSGRPTYVLARAQDVPSLSEVPLRELGGEPPVVLLTNLR
jgi:4-amino-4-deoxy-L-arabinose transferase-like glycosyltransferase